MFALSTMLKIRAEQGLEGARKAILFLFIYLLAALRSLWDLSSATRDGTHGPCGGSAES